MCGMSLTNIVKSRGPNTEPCQWYTTSDYTPARFQWRELNFSVWSSYLYVFRHELYKDDRRVV